LKLTKKGMEGKIMKKIGVVLILGMILLIPAYSVAETPVLDNGTDNFEFARLRWDFRDYGNLGTNWIGGSRLRTGAFFVFECEILTGGHLQNIEDVTKVVALNTLSNRQYILHYDPFYFGDYLVQYWLLLAQADDSMFAPWKFILHYNGSDGKEHQQIQTVLPPEKAFPAEICIFRTIPAADSGRSRPPIPIDSGHRFRTKPATHSGAFRPPIN
jgi:hypothetical protein